MSNSEHELYEFVVEVFKSLKRIESLLSKIYLQGKDEMATLQDIINAVAQETTLEGSIETLVTSLQAQLAAALSGTTLPTAVQAQVDSVFASLQSNVSTLTAAVANGTTSSSSSSSSSS